MRRSWGRTGSRCPSSTARMSCAYRSTAGRERTSAHHWKGSAMPHEIRRVLQAFASRPWFIEPRKAAEIVGMLELRAKLGPRNERYRKVMGFDQEDERSARKAEQPAPETSPGT